MRSDYVHPQEADELIAAMPVEYRGIVIAAIETGFRIGDLCGAKMWAYDIVENTITLREQKTGKFRTVSVSPRLKQVLLGAGEQSVEKYTRQTYMFEREYQTSVSRSTIWRWVNRTWTRLHKGQDRTISPHSFRKLYAVNRRDAGASLADVKNDLNHDRIETTMIYYFADLIHQTEEEEQRTTFFVT